MPYHRLPLPCNKAIIKRPLRRRYKFISDKNLEPLKSIVHFKDSMAVSRLPAATNAMWFRFNFLILSSDIMNYRSIIIRGAAIAMICLGCVGTDFITSPVMTVPPRVTVTPGNQAVLIGNTATFQAMYYDSLDTQQAATFQWTSSDTGIASISDAGVVQGLKAGQVDISASANGVAGNLARLTVVADAAMQVATVTVSPDSARLIIGDSMLFSAEAKSLDGSSVMTTVTWQSADPAVASVSGSGLVNAVSAGTTTITATADGIESMPVTVTVTSMQTSRSGQFTKRPGVNYTVNGTATLAIDPANTSRLILSFGDDFQVSNGPGIDVFLSTSNQVTSTSINLGDVKRLNGAQTYEVPAGVNLDTFDWVIIHCVPFNAVFGYAQLQTAKQ